MTQNSEIILQQVLSDRKLEVAPELTDPEFFEVFSAEQATKEYELSYEEIEEGVVDGEHDGGIDAFYTLINGEYIGEDVNFSIPKRGVDIDVVVLQSKFGSGFSEAPINKLISSLSHLLDLSSDFDELTQYSPAVKTRADIFRKAYRKSASKFPNLSITILYTSTKSASNIHKNTQLKSKELIARVRELYDEASVTFQFWGSKELLSLARKRITQTFELKFDQSLNGSSGFVALVKLPDFYKFLCNDGNEVRADLFEANVRDYQGSTEVNHEISKTLEGETGHDFWWFNNGVTVLASRASSSGSIITIENPQIVNGLQTSSEIGHYFEKKRDEENRSVMVKVVSSEDEEVRDKIIKATNSQNLVPLASLRATDKVQRDIEHHLKSNDLFYDRRKNFYKNDGKPKNKIISISLLAQAVMTLFRGEPDNARARPSSLMKDDDVYNSLFSENFELDAFLVAAKLIRRIETLLTSIDDVSAREKNNIRFYVLYWVCACKAKSLSLNSSRIAKLKGKITDDDIFQGINAVRDLFSAAGGTDQVAKGPTFKETVKEKVRKVIQEAFLNSYD